MFKTNINVLQNHFQQEAFLTSSKTGLFMVPLPLHSAPAERSAPLQSLALCKLASKTARGYKYSLALCKLASKTARGYKYSLALCKLILIKKMPQSKRQPFKNTLKCCLESDNLYSSKALQRVARQRAILKADSD